MKTIAFILTITMVSFSSFGQEEKYINAMLKTIDKMDQCRKQC